MACRIPGAREADSRRFLPRRCRRPQADRRGREPHGKEVRRMKTEAIPPWGEAPLLLHRSRRGG